MTEPRRTLKGGCAPVQLTWDENIKSFVVVLPVHFQEPGGLVAANGEVIGCVKPVVLAQIPYKEVVAALDAGAKVAVQKEEAAPAVTP